MFAIPGFQASAILPQGVKLIHCTSAHLHVCLQLLDFPRVKDWSEWTITNKKDVNAGGDHLEKGDALAVVLPANSFSPTVQVVSYTDCLLPLESGLLTSELLYICRITNRSYLLGLGAFPCFSLAATSFNSSKAKHYLEAPRLRNQRPSRGLRRLS